MNMAIKIADIPGVCAFERKFCFNPLQHTVSGANTHTEKFQLLKHIPEILYIFFTFIVCLQIAFTVLGIGLFINSGRISA